MSILILIGAVRFALHRLRYNSAMLLIPALLLASTAQAQNIDFEEFQRRTQPGNSSANAPVAYNGPSGGYPATGASMSSGPSGSSGSSDIQMQLAGLQSQIASQNSELASFRRELKSPLASSSSGAPRWYAGTEAVIVQPIQSNNSALLVRYESLEGYQSIMFPWELSISPRIYFGRESNDETLG